METAEIHQEDSVYRAARRELGTNKTFYDAFGDVGPFGVPHVFVSVALWYISTALLYHVFYYYDLGLENFLDTVSATGVVVVAQSIGLGISFMLLTKTARNPALLIFGWAFMVGAIEILRDTYVLYGLEGPGYEWAEEMRADYVGRATTGIKIAASSLATLMAIFFGILKFGVKPISMCLCGALGGLLGSVVIAAVWYGVTGTDFEIAVRIVLAGTTSGALFALLLFGALWFHRASAVISAQGNNKSRQRFRSVASESAADVERQVEEGEIFLKESQIEEALGAFTRALSEAVVDQQKGALLYNIAICHSRKGNDDLAIDALQKAVSLKPGLAKQLSNDEEFAKLRESETISEILKNAADSDSLITWATVLGGYNLFSSAILAAILRSQSVPYWNDLWALISWNAGGGIALLVIARVLKSGYKHQLIYISIMALCFIPIVEAQMVMGSGQFGANSVSVLAVFRWLMWMHVASIAMRSLQFKMTERAQRYFIYGFLAIFGIPALIFVLMLILFT